MGQPKPDFFAVMQRGRRAHFLNPDDSVFYRTVPEPNTGCLLWLGSVHSGTKRPTITLGSRPVQVARYVWNRDRALLSSTDYLYNTCGEDRCVEPAHHQLMSAMDSRTRASVLGAAARRKTHCIRGHEMAVSSRMKSDGSRECVLCYDAPERAAKNKARHVAYYDANRERIKTSSRNRRLALKRKVVGGYGGKCACCGEQNIHFLSIDHVNNNGARHRKEVRANGVTLPSGRKRAPGAAMTGELLHQWIVEHGFPSDFQVLCYNCNCSRTWFGGVCPHEFEVVNG